MIRLLPDRGDLSGSFLTADLSKRHGPVPICLSTPPHIRNSSPPPLPTSGRCLGEPPENHAAFCLEHVQVVQHSFLRVEQEGAVVINHLSRQYLLSSETSSGNVMRWRVIFLDLCGFLIGNDLAHTLKNGVLPRNGT